MKGKTEEEARSELEKSGMAPEKIAALVSHKVCYKFGQFIYFSQLTMKTVYVSIFFTVLFSAYAEF